MRLGGGFCAPALLHLLCSLVTLEFLVGQADLPGWYSLDKPGAQRRQGYSMLVPAPPVPLCPGQPSGLSKPCGGCRYWERK